MGAVGDVGGVRGPPLVRLHLALDEANGQAEEPVDASHPLGVAAGEGVGYGGDVNPLPLCAAARTTAYAPGSMPSRVPPATSRERNSAVLARSPSSERGWIAGSRALTAATIRSRSFSFFPSPALRSLFSRAMDASSYRWGVEREPGLNRGKARETNITPEGVPLFHGFEHGTRIRPGLLGQQLRGDVVRRKRHRPVAAGRGTVCFADDNPAAAAILRGRNHHDLAPGAPEHRPP